MTKKPEVSVVIGHYGHGDEVFRCLEKLQIIKNKFKSIEFVLLDNNEVKSDKTKITKKYPWVKYLTPTKNLGWGAGRNLAIKETSGKYILSLDSDILIDYKSFANIYKILEKNKKIGIVSPRLKNISGKFHSEITKELTPIRGIFFMSFLNKIFPNNPISKGFLMADVSRDKSRYVDVLQLGGFMIRREAYENMGGFDENIFLYFEENDLGKSLKKLGYKLFFDSKSKVIHLESKGTPKSSDEIKKVFSESRFYYFKKHFGLLSALIVDGFARINKNALIILGIILLSIFLRFYRLQENMPFNGEIGYDYITIRNYIVNHQIPLIGPRTSHEWFFIGPIFYWIFGILLPIFNYNPAVGAYFFAIVGVISIPVCYWVINKLYGQKAAWISSFLLAISPLWAQLFRDARFNAMTAVLFFPFYYLLVKSTEDKGKSLVTLGIILGVMFSFFPSPILLIPASILVILFFRKNYEKKYYLPSILAFLVVNIPYLIYNAIHKFEILFNLFAWLPYRILGFVGLYPKNTASPQVLQSNLVGLYVFFQQSYLQNNNILILILFICVLIYTIFALKKNRPLQVLVILSVVSYIGLFLHGDPPEHYYLVIFPVPIILLSLFLNKVSEKYKLITIIVLGYLVVGNFKYYFSNKWFYLDQTKISSDMNYLPYVIQVKIAKFIVSDSDSKQFSISRVGPYDEFGENFSLNYQYLMWNNGKLPDKSAKLKYTIYEDTSTLPKNERIYWVENIAITKNEKP